MSTFAWLLLGHLVGDWVLQNDWMAQGKKQGWVTLPGLIHFTLYTAAILAALWLAEAGHNDLRYYGGLGAFVFLTHWLIDASDLVERWITLYHQSDILLMRIMVDQTLHLLVLAVVVQSSPPVT